MQSFHQKIVCACCGKSTQVKVSRGRYINDCGLDQKPKYEYQLLDIQECPYCHYCSVSLDRPVSEEVKRSVFSEGYQKFMNEGCADMKARRLKAAVELAQAHEEKIHLYLMSCWYFEFRNKMHEAAAMREKAVAVMENEALEKPSIELAMIYIDSLRQLGRFAQCSAVISELDALADKNLDKEDTVYKVLQLEKHLLEVNDNRPYMVRDCI